MKLSTKKILITLSIIFLFACSQQAQYVEPSTSNKEALKKPNILVILADDLGSGDVSYFNRNILRKPSTVETPAIDSLAERGIWFNNGHSATALCAPTRYAVLSGNNNYRSYAPWGVWNTFRPNAIKDTDMTLANAVKPQGYRTGFIGKWHLGGDFAEKGTNKVYRGTDYKEQNKIDLTKMIGGGPNNLGFDYSYMLPTGIQGPIYLAYENQIWHPLHKDSKIKYLDENTAIEPKIVSDKGPGMGDSHWDTRKMGDILSQKAVNFITQKASNEPFFLYYATPMVHIPHMPPAKFDGEKVAGSTPSAHLDMIKELDLQINRILNALKQSGQYDNTLVVLVSDNGGLLKKGSIQAGHKTSGIYRGSKNLPYEGGHRTPYIISWPAKIKSGQISDEAVVVQDILATIAAASGRQLNAEEAPDSNNLLPLVTNQEQFFSRNQMFLQGGSKTQAIYVKNNWKLILQSNYKLNKFEPIALFDLSNNIRELESGNLVNTLTDRVERMREEYLTIRESKQPTAPKYLSSIDKH
ncbi:sulfatase family protein [Gayadomonas joobiniege]|uniref:sulfatase family protein n=1 Tax=Gayadomonas joobiniege TaxID=1234606 RepID=UPI000360F1CA|nr:arylsulfatase [Gayadomonas joobiniege]